MSCLSIFVAGLALLTVNLCKSAEVQYGAPLPYLSAQWFLLHELTRPPGLCVWEIMKELKRCNARGLRDLATEVREAQSRGIPLTAAPLLIEAAAERDLAGTLADIFADMKQEPSPAAPRVNMASDAVFLSSRMAGRDWKKLLKMLDAVKRDPSFWLPLAAAIELPPEKLPAFLTVAARGTEAQLVPPIADRVLWTTVKQHGVRTTTQAVKTIKSRAVRQAVEESLRDLTKDPPRPSPPSPGKSPPLKSPALRRLLALDTLADEPRGIPFALHRAVLQLSPAEALGLARELPRDPAPGHWLSWMLFMRAAESDAAAAAAVATETGGQLIRAGQPLATLFALRPEVEAGAVLQEIRSFTSPDAQRQALSGFLTGRAAQALILGQQGNPLLAFAMQTKLPASCWRAGLCQAAASGGGEVALHQAQNLTWEPSGGRAMLQEDIIKAWALTDLPSLKIRAAKLTNPDEIKTVNAALTFLGPLLPNPAE